MKTTSLSAWDHHHLHVHRNSNAAIVVAACYFEVRAKKIGNVHPTAAFVDLNFHDFLYSAIALAGTFEERGDWSEWIEHAVKMTRIIVAKNTNLGIILLLGPLIYIKPCFFPLQNPPGGGEYDFKDDLDRIMRSTTVEDAIRVYRAIREAHPGSLGEVREQNVYGAPTVTLLETMKLAADRDLIARQYANNYADVFDLGVPALMEGYKQFGNIEAAVIHCQLAWMAEFPDSLIARKRGVAVAEDVRERVRAIQQLGGLATAEGRASGVALDKYLRSDGNKLNPGTTADLVCACLFVALREGKIPLNAPFEWKVEDWL